VAKVIKFVDLESEHRFDDIIDNFSDYNSEGVSIITTISLVGDQIGITDILLDEKGQKVDSLELILAKNDFILKIVIENWQEKYDFEWHEIPFIESPEDICSRKEVELTKKLIFLKMLVFSPSLGTHWASNYYIDATDANCFHIVEFRGNLYLEFGLPDEVKDLDEITEPYSIIIGTFMLTDGSYSFKPSNDRAVWFEGEKLIEALKGSEFEHLIPSINEIRCPECNKEYPTTFNSDNHVNWLCIECSHEWPV
jgi:hypothetical protein